MPRVRDVLYRFRPAGTPGAASAAGVPADRAADLAVELQPLFAQLAITERTCADIVAEGDRAAGGLRDRDAAQARRILATASDRLDGERAAAAALVQQRGVAKSADEMVAAEHHAAELSARAAERLPSFVEQVVLEVCILIDRQPADSCSV